MYEINMATTLLMNVTTTVLMLVGSYDYNLQGQLTVETTCGIIVGNLKLTSKRSDVMDIDYVWTCVKADGLRLVFGDYEQETVRSQCLVHRSEKYNVQGGWYQNFSRNVLSLDRYLRMNVCGLLTVKSSSRSDGESVILVFEPRGETPEKSYFLRILLNETQTIAFSVSVTLLLVLIVVVGVRSCMKYRGQVSFV